MNRSAGLALEGPVAAAEFRAFTLFFAAALAWESGFACLAAVCLGRGAHANG